MRTTIFVRSANQLTQEVRANMRELTGRQIRDLRPSTNPAPVLSRSEAARLLDDLRELLEELQGRHEALEELAALARSSSSARRDHFGLVAEGLGMPRDADGNVIHVDARDRPYVYVANGQIVYVKVYQARVTPKGVNLDAKCTVANPDDTEEVLLVEQIPSLGAPPGAPF